ncbi:MAG: carbonic anhydrase family protein, partial [Alphaproteobacteria bacterium]|nr:carbonic anhydrase family protein [Alphaproteobacteria bacterium]
ANSATDPEGVMFNGGDLLPANRRYYHFVGSLTTPPCSEGVQWHVLKQPITASSEQIDAFLRVIGPNNRPVQKVNGRLVIDSQK